MQKRTLTMLADDYNPLKFKAEGSFMSEKLDGVRALWLPWTRNLPVENIPFANRLKDKREYICSGLWTRRGKVIVAPDWWLDQLPKDMPLDGELFIGRNLFNKTVGTVRKLEPVDTEWAEIAYRIFDIPSFQQFFKTGWIREGGKAGEPAYEVLMKETWAADFNLMSHPFYKQRRFTEVMSFFKNVQLWNNVVYPVEFQQLPFSARDAEEIVATRLIQITELGAEGLMLRRPHTCWEPIRHNELVKVKKMLDSEAQILGYVAGSGKYLGMVGAFRVRWNPTTSRGPIVFDLSGFTDIERQVKFEFQTLFKENPEKFFDVPASQDFPIGCPLTFRYNDVTPDGKPRFARYWRKYQV